MSTPLTVLPCGQAHEGPRQQSRQNLEKEGPYALRERNRMVHDMDAASGTPPVPTRFEVAALPPFRLDLTVWALRRRPGNLVDRWDGRTYAPRCP